MDLSLLAEGNGRWAWITLLGAVGALWLLFRWWPRSARMPAGTPRTLDAVDTVIGWPPEATRVLTHRHRRAYDVLRRAMPEYLVFAQVPISRFIRVPMRASYAEWLRRVGSVSVDLLLCDRSSHVVAVVEVREAGRSLSERARRRQHRVERVLRAAGVPYQVWDEAWLPDPIAVRKTLLADADAMAEGMPDDGMPTLPMEVPAPSFAQSLAGGDLQGDWGEPPRSTWFDEATATRPAPLQDPAPRVPPAESAGSGYAGLQPQRR